MNSAEYVEQQIEILKTSGIPLSDVAWQTALNTVGWPYVYAARGEKCTPANRRARYSAAHPTIKSKCKNFDGKGTCEGCKWYPKKKRVLFFDCRRFTYWVLLKIYGWKLAGAGATSQWNTAKNWTAKGTIKDLPTDQLVCLFQQSKDNKKKMSHTGLGFRGETIECSNGVQYKKTTDKKWTHWAIPACTGGVTPQDPPTPPDPPAPKPKKHPTIRKGSSGSAVKECQADLIALGYDVGTKGADGKFGKDTLAAVKAFQKAESLKVDGIVGAKTWEALDKATGKSG